MEKHHSLSYIEIPSKDLASTKAFFNEVFDWEFVDYGPDYSCFTGQCMNGGFFSAQHSVNTENGSPLIVLYSAQLEATQAKVEGAGGEVSKPIFSFPGGRRFHFIDTSGNEYAVWSE